MAPSAAPDDLAQVEERITALLDRYRPELVDGTIYGMRAWVWPGATGHDYVERYRAERT